MHVFLEQHFSYMDDHTSYHYEIMWCFWLNQPKCKTPLFGIQSWSRNGLVTDPYYNGTAFKLFWGELILPHFISAGKREMKPVERHQCFDIIKTGTQTKA